MLIAVPILVVLLAWFMTRTRLGLMVRAAASNPDKARLVGISVARTSTLVWGISAAFTATTIIVLAAVQFVTPLGAANGTAQLTLGYPLLVKALLVAMIARMRILWLTIPVGIALGIIEVDLPAERARHRRQRLLALDLPRDARRRPHARAASRGSRPTLSRRGSSPVAPSRCPSGCAACGRCGSCPASGCSRCSRVFVLIPVFAQQASQSFLWTACRDLRDRGVLADDPERLGGPAVARPVRVLRHRRPRHRAAW